MVKQLISIKFKFEQNKSLINLFMNIILKLMKILQLKALEQIIQTHYEKKNLIFKICLYDEIP